MKLNPISLGDIVTDLITGQQMTAQKRYRTLIDAAVIADQSGFNGIAHTVSTPPVLLMAIITDGAS